MITDQLYDIFLYYRMVSYNMQTQQLTRNEFIKKFNALDVADKTAILLKAGVTNEESKQIDSDTNAAEIVENFTDGTELIHNIWTIMEEAQNTKKWRRLSGFEGGSKVFLSDFEVSQIEKQIDEANKKECANQ